MIQALFRVFALAVAALLIGNVMARPSEAPYIVAKKPIFDDQGRTAVIVDFVEDSEDLYPDEIDNKVKIKPAFARGLSFHRSKAQNLVSKYEDAVGFSHTGMTSHVGTSFTAFLTDSQIRKLRADKDVRLVTQDSRGDISAFSQANPPPPWSNNPVSANGAEQHSWGRIATKGKQKVPGSLRRVFVIDSGVAYHDDLNSVVVRTNVGCGSVGGCENLNNGYWPVGCYAHATHVAGIIAATNGNGKTSAGVYAGVDIVSVSPLFGYSNCGNSDFLLASSVGYALDYVYNQVCANNGGRVGIVNMSINGAPAGIGTKLVNGVPVLETNAGKVHLLATSIGPPFKGKDSRCRIYPGALVVQSAGNQNSNVCSVNATQRYAYTPWSGYGALPTAAAVNDGVMVVGAIKANGQQAAVFFASVPAGIVATDPGSNYGACVDVWAPGDRIVSAWGAHVGNTIPVQTYSGSAPNGSAGWGYVSGTSMAAPHVVAAPAYLADDYGITTSNALETKVRDFTVALGVNDAAGIPIKIVQLP